MKRLKRLSSLATASVLSVSALFNIALMPVVHAAVDTCTWTGAVNNNFNNAGNWTGCDNGNLPEAGDTILLQRLTGGGSKSLVNDLGVTFGGVNLAPGVVTDNTNFTVDTLALADNAIVDSTNTSSAETSLSVSNLTGAGGVVIRQSTPGGSPAFYLSTSTVNIAGSLTIESGASVDLSPAAVIGGLILEKGSYVTFSSLSASHTLAAPLTLGGGSGTGAPTLYFSCIQSGPMSCSATAVTWNITGAINLLGDANIYVGGNTSSPVTVNVTGALSGTGALKKDPNSSGTLNVNPSSNTSPTQTGSLRNSAKSTTISDSQPAVAITVVDNETTTLSGTRQSAIVNSGGVLKGTGIITDFLQVSTGGIVAPGNSPGCLSSGDLTLAGTYQAEIGGTTACTDYDQLKVTGLVDITGSTLESTLYNGFVPTVGQSYTIIDNDAADAVTGTFAGIAEGGSYTNQGVTYSVTYVGGDGNDVVLTVESIDASLLPKAPNTGFKLLVTNPVMTLIAATTAAGAILIARKRLQKVTAKRR